MLFASEKSYDKEKQQGYSCVVYQLHQYIHNDVTSELYFLFDMYSSLLSIDFISLANYQMSFPSFCWAIKVIGS